MEKLGIFRGGDNWLYKVFLLGFLVKWERRLVWGLGMVCYKIEIILNMVNNFEEFIFGLFVNSYFVLYRSVLRSRI